MDYAQQAYEEYIGKCPLTKDMSIEVLQGELNRFWDGVMLHVTRSTGDNNVRSAYRILSQQARTQCNVLQWLGEPEVFYSTSGAAKGKRRLPILGLLSAAIMAALAIWFYIPHQGRSVVLAGLSGAALVLLVIQCFLLMRSVPTVPDRTTRAEQRIDPQQVCSGLKRLVLEMDSHADSLKAILAESATHVGEVDLSLAQELMRIPANQRGAGTIEAVDRFLIRNGVEKVEYSPQNQHLFMVLPGPQQMTIEPALIKDGKLLNMGVACTAAEG